ncbi:MAG TPA: VOC family protein [Fimbriimonadaceae bacterium]|nr:VOC family protein [Fimbriimonadaceae bacterium]
MAKNTICHIELQTTDLGRAQTFFGALFDWQFRAFGDSMVVFGSGDDHVGGLFKVDSVRPADYAVAWIEVDDVESTLAAAVTAGGSVNSAKKPVPGVGWSGEFADLDGNPIGVVQFDR